MKQNRTPEYELLVGVFYWDERASMYSALVRGGVPGPLVTAAQSEPHNLVRWASSSEMENPSSWQFTIVPGFAEQRREDRTDVLPRTVEEALAFWLVREAHRTKTSKGAAVRSGKVIPKAVLAWVAFDLLKAHKQSPPGPWLKQLIFSLLGLTPPSQKVIARYVAREQAASVIAGNKNIRSAEVAAQVSVDPSSVSRWRTSKQFRNLVEEKRAAMMQPRTRPTRIGRDAPSK